MGAKSTVRIYWYAPFNNADELELAAHIQRTGDSLTVQSLGSRFGRPLPSDGCEFDLVRDLPEPAGESGGHRGPTHRLAVALSRSRRRSRLIRRSQFDLLHIHTFNMFTDWHALPRLRDLARPLVGTIHNVLPHDRRGPRSTEHWLHARGYRAFDHMFVAHEHLQQLLEEQFEIPHDRITVVPLPVLPPPPSSTGGPDRPIDPEFLFFGTLRENKGIPVLLDAIAQVANPDVRFRFAGRGPVHLEQLVRTAAKHDPRIVAEIGFVEPDRQAELMRNAWALLLPYTEFAAQSGVLRNAYAFGVPVIASAVGALGASVRDEMTGWIVPPGDAQALAASIENSIGSGSPRADLASNCARLADERRPDRIAALMRNQYTQLTK